MTFRNRISWAIRLWYRGILELPMSALSIGISRYPGETSPYALILLAIAVFFLVMSYAADVSVRDPAMDESLTTGWAKSSSILTHGNVAVSVVSSRIMRSPLSPYNWTLSTEENYRSGSPEPWVGGRFAEIRAQLDYRYHGVYTPARQMFQDGILQSMLINTTVPDIAENNELGTCPNPRRPWIVFTAGVMGAGKTHTIRQLADQGHFPLESFVRVDPDEIRARLPEFSTYVQVDAERAGDLTRKEAGMMAEILTLAALQRGQNVLVDGSLRDSKWYLSYLQFLRQMYPLIKTGILHITAPREAVFARALSRAKLTGRVVPMDLLKRTMEEVPKSVAVLEKNVDLTLEVHNAPGLDTVEIVTKGVTWKSFEDVWKQDCLMPA